MPFTWSADAADTRRILLHRFPYKVVYRIAGQRAVVVAIAHLKRQPGYWQSR